MPTWLGVVVAIVASIVFPLVGLAVSWGALGVRIRNLESLPTRVEDMAKHLAQVDSRTADSARSQGERLQKAQTDVDKLTGKVEGLDRGFALASRQRSRTAAQGHAVGGKDE